MDRRSFIQLTVAASAVTALSSSAAFADWAPRRPVNLILPYKAGGGTDSFARAVSASAASALPVPVVVVNKPGSSGITGATEAAAARPDGTTFMMTSSGSFLLTWLLRDTKVNPFDNFRMVAQIGNLNTSLMVPTDSPYKTLEDLVADAKANPGKLKWAHTGRGGFHHVAGQGFLNSVDLKAGDVPFKGGSATRAAVIGGQVDFAMIGIQQAAGFEGKLRVLALVSDTRDAFAKDVATFAEQGYKIPLVSSPIIVYAPLGTPDDVVSGMESALKKITQDAEFIKVMAGRGNAPAFLSGVDARTRLETMRVGAEPIVAALK